MASMSEDEIGAAAGSDNEVASNAAAAPSLRIGGGGRFEFPLSYEDGAGSGSGAGAGGGVGSGGGVHMASQLGQLEGLAPSRHCVCMVSDFFYPRLGGVEMHLWAQAQCLIKRGHKVLVVTNAHGKRRRGIRYMTNGLKVYYTPMTQFVDGAAFPTMVGSFMLFRRILIREGVTVVHGHQATSVMAHECFLVARTMGYKCVYTDHSLFGFADAASINVNKFLKFSLSDISHAIAVSHTCRENLVLRASINPRKVSAIPNAVDASKFTPDPSARYPPHTINIVMINRLVYRKGVDLAAKVIPEMCRLFPNVHFIIGGDGNKRLLLEEMREKHQLHDRVELLGAVPHTNVRDVLVRGHIFLNCSLTEAFCIAIVEAACCGLFVVSTRVGGVPEVLKRHMVQLAEPNANALVQALSSAVRRVQEVDPYDFHENVRDMYDWDDVAARTVAVYDKIAGTPEPPLIDRFRRYYSAGLMFGWICCAIVSILYIINVFLEWLVPAATIERCPDFPYQAYAAHRDRLHQEHAPLHHTRRRTSSHGGSSSSRRAGGSGSRRRSSSSNTAGAGAGAAGAGAAAGRQHKSTATRNA